MSDFDRIVKHLDITPARIATEQEGADAIRPFSKYYSIHRSRAIQKLSDKILVPSHGFTNPDPSVAWIVYQFVFSVDRDFTILNSDQLYARASSKLLSGFACIRYREGTTATRYLLMATPQQLKYLHVDRYVPGTVIKKNFVIEIWAEPGQNSAEIFNTAFDILTTNLSNPTTAEQIENVIATGTVVESELFVALPENIPTDYNELGPWLDNT